MVSACIEEQTEMAFGVPRALGSTLVSEEAMSTYTRRGQEARPARATAGAVKAEDNPPAQQPKLSSSTKKDVALYGLARLLLFIVLTAIIHGIVLAMGMAQSFPLLMSALLALILALPLSMLLFRKLRLRVNSEIARWDSDRRAHKEQMRRQLQERLD